MAGKYGRIVVTLSSTWGSDHYVSLRIIIPPLRDTNTCACSPNCFFMRTSMPGARALNPPEVVSRAEPASPAPAIPPNTCVGKKQEPARTPTFRGPTAGYVPLSFKHLFVYARAAHRAGKDTGRKDGVTFWRQFHTWYQGTF